MLCKSLHSRDRTKSAVGGKASQILLNEPSHRHHSYIKIVSFSPCKKQSILLKHTGRFQMLMCFMLTHQEELAIKKIPKLGLV